MSTLGFDNFVEPLKIYLQKYRESTKGEKSTLNTSQTEGAVEDLNAEDTFATLGTSIISAEQQPVIYTTYTTQPMFG